MLDIKLIRERPDFVKGELAKRGIDPAEVDQLLEVDQKRRKLQGELDQIRADRKRRAKEVGKLPPEERAAEIAKIRAEEADEEKLVELFSSPAGEVTMLATPRWNWARNWRSQSARSRSWRLLSPISRGRTSSSAPARPTTA